MESAFQLAIKKIEGGQYWKTAFDWISPIHNGGIWLVEIGERYAYYLPESKSYLVDESYSMARPFNGERTIVKEDGRGYNVLNSDGSYLFDKWYEYIDFSIWCGKETFFVVDDGHWMLKKC